MTIPKIPPVYPDGGPLFWMNETSGVLKAAVTAYLHQEETPEQLGWVIAYCRYWIEAPCWRGAEELALVCKDLDSLKTHADLSGWLYDALALGIDPL